MIVILLAIKLLFALTFFLLPGFLSNGLWKLTDDWLESLPISFGFSMVGLTLLNLPLFIFRLNMYWIIGAWVVWIGVLAFVLFRQGKWAGFEREHFWPHRIVGGVIFVALILVTISLFTSGSVVTGEEEVELIITRKVLENAEVTLTNVNYLDGLPATYLLVPLYLFRAFLSFVTGIDPVLLHYRMAFFSPVLVSLVLYAIIKEVTKSRNIASIFLILALVHLFFSSPNIPNADFRHVPFYVGLLFRGTISTQVLAPLCVLFLLKAVGQEKEALYTMLCVALFSVTLFTQAIVASYLLLFFGIMVVALLLHHIFAREDRPQIRRKLRNVGALVAGAVFVLLMFRLGFNAYHTSTQSLEAEIRNRLVSEVKEQIEADPVSLLYEHPPPVSEFIYYQNRSFNFGLFSQGFVLNFSVLSLLSFLLAPVLVFFMPDYRIAFILLTYIVPVAILKIPALYVPALIVSNSSLFNGFYGQLSIFYYLWLFLPVAILVSYIVGLLGRSVATPRVLYRVVLAGAFVLLLVSLGFTQIVGSILEYFRDNPDSLIAVMLVGFALAFAAKRLLAIRPQWTFEQSSALAIFPLCFALLLPLLAKDFSTEPQSNNLAASSVENFDNLKGLEVPYQAYTENYEISRNATMTQGLFDSLIFVRDNLPEGQTFTAFPPIIRFIPYLSNQYVVHSGVPFDFVEDYFLDYAATKFVQIQSDRVAERTILEYHDPLFVQDAALIDDVIEESIKYLERFEVDYVLVSPETYEYTTALLDALVSESCVDASIVYEQRQYAIYHIEGTIAAKPDDSPCGMSDEDRTELLALAHGPEGLSGRLYDEYQQFLETFDLTEAGTIIFEPSSGLGSVDAAADYLGWIVTPDMNATDRQVQFELITILDRSYDEPELALDASEAALLNEWRATKRPEHLNAIGIDYLLVSGAWRSFLSEEELNILSNAANYQLVQTWQLENAPDSYWLYESRKAE